MRSIDREQAACPDDLIEKGAQELAKAEVHYANPDAKTFKFSKYKLPSVKRELEKLFHGKCAYCETFYSTSHPMDVEHYRPKGAVSEAPDHKGYWWIAMDWNNLFPSCIDCNRKRNQIIAAPHTSLVELIDRSVNSSGVTTISSGKKDSFPILGTRADAQSRDLSSEMPLLLDPALDTPEEHLLYYFDFDNPISLVVPRKLDNQNNIFRDPVSELSMKGSSSIHVYGLNRLRLVQERTEIVRQLEFLSDLVIDLFSFADEIMSDTTIQNPTPICEKITNFANLIIFELKARKHEKYPYSAMVSAWLNEFEQRLVATIATS